jgi:hypothetical protein
MYCVTKASQPPSWRGAATCDACNQDEYCTSVAPDGDWVWDVTSGTHRPPTDAEILQAAIATRIVALKAEVEGYIDAQILPYTRGMLRDGVLDAATAEALRDFISDCYTEANDTIDAIELVGTLAEVDDPAPIWPTYGA